jgi:hypothetical protein
MRKRLSLELSKSTAANGIALLDTNILPFSSQR